MTATLKTTIIQEPSSNVVNLQLGTAGQVGLGGANYGTAGQVIVSGGANAAPSWAQKISVTETVFESSGTYTPNANGSYYEVVCIGGGSSASQSNSGSTTRVNGVGGPGAGGAVVGFTKSQMGNSPITVTIGAGGAYNTSNSTPQAGGASSFGNYITANGGGNSANVPGNVVVSVGTANVSASGNVGNSSNTRSSGFSIRPYSGPTGNLSGFDGPGVTATLPGAGGGGGSVAATANTNQTVNGGGGGPGIVIVREYF